MTLQLPEHCMNKLQHLIRPLLTQKRISLHKWRILFGTLRCSLPPLYGINHLFSSLQYAIWGSPWWVTLTKPIHAILPELLPCPSSAHHYLVPLHALVPHLPQLAAATDASRHGMGGCWIDLANPESPPTLWHHTFPEAIQSALKSSTNPNDTLTNSDLELVAHVTGTILVTQNSHHQHPHISIASNNIPAVAWLQKGSNSSTWASAFLLHQLTQYHRTRPFTYTTVFTPGISNQIADCCSRLVHFSDLAFLAHMKTIHPVQPCWMLATLTDDMKSRMTCALSNKQLPLPLPPHALELVTLHSGRKLTV